MENRFRDKNITLFQFEDEIFVQCPKCSKRATVTKVDPTSYYSDRILKCTNCFYSQINRQEFYGISLNCNCPNCANGIKVSIENAKEKKDTLSIKCSKCGETNDYEPRNFKYHVIYKSTGNPSEGYFGLPLWLSENFRGNDFWAYNYRHLEYLKQYIIAGLREKNDRVGWTMVEKLPSWMKSAKNREKLTKLISELEKK